MPPTFDNTKPLRNERTRLINELRGMIETAEAGNGGKGRALTREERAKFDKTNAEIDALTDKIESREAMTRAVLTAERANGRAGDEAEYRARFATEVRDLTTGGFGGAL